MACCGPDRLKRVVCRDPYVKGDSGEIIGTFSIDEANRAAAKRLGGFFGDVTLSSRVLVVGAG